MYKRQYVDHPSFGAAIIARVLESQGFRAVSYTHLDVYKRQIDEFAMLVNTIYGTVRWFLYVRREKSMKAAFSAKKGEAEPV